MSIKGIALDKKSELPLLLLQAHNNGHVLPLWIGPFEASAIITEVEGVHPPRPLTHDLFTQFFSKHNFTLTSLELYEKLEDRYFARINYRKGVRTYTMEVRPSDGIALALRLHAPIYARSTLVSEHTAEYFIKNNEELLSSDLLLLKKNGNNSVNNSHSH